jgi:quinolinate synthase
MNNDLIVEIKRLKQETGALVLAHNYQAVKILDLADFRGDSLQLSIMAKEANAPLIVFCGVKFMAETAAILNPDSKILLPAPDAGCPMADMIDAKQLRAFKKNYPGSPVVCYVNSSVEVKAESDICCTSSNAVKVLKSFAPEVPILFVPDRNLGNWAARQADRKVIAWDGFCPVHQLGFSEEDVFTMREKFPGYTLLAHPECDPLISKHADIVMSTGGMMKWIEQGDKVIIATDNGLTNYLKHLYPHKHIESLSDRANCKNMKKTTLEHLHDALLKQQYVVEVDSEIADKARLSIERMLAIS